MQSATKYSYCSAIGIILLIAKHMLPETVGLGRLFGGILLLLGVYFLFYLTIDRYLKLQQRKRVGLRGPPALIFIGNLHQIGKIMAANGQLLYNVYEQWKKDYGKLYAFYMGPRLFVIVEQLDMIREILVTKFDCFTDRMEMDFLTDALRNSIVNAKGLTWRHMRSQMCPIFTTARLREMGHNVHEKVNIFLNNIYEFSETGETFDIYEHYKALTLNVIARCAFALTANCQSDINDTFLAKCADYFNSLPSPQNSLLMNISVLLPELAPLLSSLHSRTSKSGRSEAWLYQCISRIVESRRNNSDVSGTNDLIRMLLNKNERFNKLDVKKKPLMCDEQIQTSCFAFLLAGYETISTALAFSTWLLAKHQEVQQKLYEEIRDAIHNVEEENFYDTVIHLPYLDAVFHETLRLYPPITFFVNRTCTKYCNVGGVDFYPGVQIGIPIWNIHRDPDLWSEPDQFKPKRFLSKYDPMSWLPFGIGPRNCIGMRFAAMEFKITLAGLLLQFKVSTDLKEELIVQNPTAMLQTPYIKVKVEQR